VAKIVVDIECNINQMEAPVARTIERKLEAQIGESRVSNSAQLEVEEGGSVQQLVLKTSKVGGVVSSPLCVSPLGGLEVRQRQELQEGSIVGERAMKCGSAPRMKMGSGIQNQCPVYEVSDDNGGIGVAVLGEVLGEGEACDRNRSTSSPVRRKKKGLAELGDSSSQPRRSVRINERLTQVGFPYNHKDRMPLVSISDKDISNCNTRLNASSLLAEPTKLWEIGKHVGVRWRREGEEVIKEYESMEEKDSDILECTKEGNKSGFNVDC